MDFSGFDTQITELNRKVENSREHVESACGNVLTRAEEFLVDWTRQRIERAVTSQPDKAKTMGVVRLRALKADLELLCDQMPELVRKQLSRDAIWRHRLTSDKEHNEQSFDYRVYGQRGPTILDQEIRVLLGYAGALLGKYGLLQLGEGSNWERTQPTALPKFRYAYDWSSELLSAVSTYSDALEELRGFENELQAVERAKAENEAKDLWDKA